MFLWGTLLAPLPSSRLAAKLGPVRIFGTGIVGAGALAVLVPFGAWFSTYHIAIRFIQGLFTVSTISLRSSNSAHYDSCSGGDIFAKLGNQRERNAVGRKCACGFLNGRSLIIRKP